MNTPAKHAPGPWAYTPPKRGERRKVLAFDGAYIVAADIAGEGNALLIAAAPDMAEAMLSILALYKEDPDDLETMDKGIKLMEPVLRKAGLLS